MTAPNSTITVRNAQGDLVAVNFNRKDTMLDLRHRLEHAWGYPTAIYQAVIICGRVSEDNIQLVEDARLVCDWEQQPQGTLQITPQLSTSGSNWVGKLEARDNTATSVGQIYSVRAMRAIASGREQPPLWNTEVESAKLKDEAVMLVGEITK
ncbi:hypothetical protein B0T10DRAFT_132938 [Thelonectria olida]|uniref:Ubiquitin-like domain-containing protein n=1 Tax=Thelonectria olida TaxID=1576542 RepID=A0A9P9AIR1_9HYPO|nr:hypothetical protein B0T10DRAFT_132938 [Thelonectria olida]